MGKYHPHGDSSIYEALVVMAQDFKKGLPLVDGHGNFGSIEGDGAAAMRYTEARLQKVTQEAFLADLDKDIVDFTPNFDETEREPSVLPVRLPNFLINGSDGIAVGMVTSTPPHNLGEVIDAVKAYMKNDQLTTADLMQYIQGPDFPTGGIVVNKDELLSIYETGSGKIKIRGRVAVEQDKNGKMRLVITEIPYTMIGANIGKFLNDVYALVETKKTTDIIDISNQSSKEGIRIVLELKKQTDVDNLLALLYKKTRLEDTFSVNMLAIADGRPETLGLKSIIEYFLDFQYELNTRKYQKLLAKELEKQEIQEGLMRACDIIDLIIEILRGSKNIKQAKACLTNGITEGIRFKTKASEKMAAKLDFTEAQATAILEMRLYKLIGLELEALLKEHDATLKNIATYRDILENHKSMSRVIVRELDAIRKEYATPRKTTIENAKAVVYEEKKPEEMEVVLLIDRFGYAKTIDKATFERNREAAVAENRHVIHCMNTDKACIFTDTGRLHLIKIADIPFGRFRDKAVPMDNLGNYDSSGENMLFVCSLNSIRESRLLFATKTGMLKLVAGSEFDVSKKTVAATKLADGDSLLNVCVADNFNQIVLQTENGYFIRFPMMNIPEMKKTAIGVRGINLSASDSVTGAYPLDSNIECKIIHNDKEVILNKLKLVNRGGKGTKIRV
jgi:DNA gyrase subunit A